MSNDDSIAVLPISHLPRMYFLHIPKTAGTSFKLWLDRQYGVGEVLRRSHLSELDATPDDEIGARRFYSGHFGWRLMERTQAIGTKVDAVTMLRQPAQLYRSLLDYVGTVAPEMVDMLGVAKTHFEDLAAASRNGPSADIPKVFHNIAVSNIAAAGTAVLNPPLPDMAMLAVAKQRLAAMRFFGLVEDWPRSAVLFADAFKLPLRFMDERMNVRSGPNDSARAEALQQLSGRPFLALDDELYAYGKALFEERWRAVAARCDLTADAPVEAFRSPLMRQFLDQPLDPGLLRKRGRIAVSSGIVTDGIQARYAAPDGGWRLWAGPVLESHLFLPLERSADLTLRFEFAVFMSPAIRGGIRVAIDGAPCRHELEFRKQADGSHVTALRLICPRRVTGPGPRYTDVRFDVPAAVAVAERAFQGAVTFALGDDIGLDPC